MRYVPALFSEIELEYVRSRGPGGQHVNKTNSAALLRWNLWQSQIFTEEEKQRIAVKIKKALTVDGDVVLRSDEFRDQEANRKRCLEKLEDLLVQAFFVQKKRKATRPTRSSQVRRREEKKRRGQVKSGRGRIQGGDWEKD